MSPLKQYVKGIGGCLLATGRSSNHLQDGSSTYELAVTVSLLFAEPSSRRWQEGRPISCEAAAMRGYRIVRSYEDAVAYGLV